MINKYNLRKKVNLAVQKDLAVWRVKQQTTDPFCCELYKQIKIPPVDQESLCAPEAL